MTDVSNASRTMLMDIETLQWDSFLLNFFDIPRNILPEIRSSSEVSLRDSSRSHLKRRCKHSFISNPFGATFSSIVDHTKQ